MATFGVGLLMQRGVWVPLSAIGVLALLPLLVERISRKRRHGVSPSVNTHDQ